MVRRLLALGILAVAVVGAWRWAEAEMPGWYARLRYPLDYAQIVKSHAENYGLDPALLAAVIYRESKFNAKAVSESGAIGLMQLLPETAKGIAKYTGGAKFRVEDLYNPEINVRYGSFYLKRLLTKYGDVEHALAAYNAGQANVDRWLAEGKKSVPFPETRAYVQAVLDLRDLYRKAYGVLRLAPS